MAVNYHYQSIRAPAYLSIVLCWDCIYSISEIVISFNHVTSNIKSFRINKFYRTYLHVHFWLHSGLSAETVIRSSSATQFSE